MRVGSTCAKGLAIYNLQPRKSSQNATILGDSAAKDAKVCPGCARWLRVETLLRENSSAIGLGGGQGAVNNSRVAMAALENEAAISNRCSRSSSEQRPPRSAPNARSAGIVSRRIARIHPLEIAMKLERLNNHFEAVSPVRCRVRRASLCDLRPPNYLNSATAHQSTGA